jgi:hypothetical protein
MSTIAVVQQKRFSRNSSNLHDGNTNTSIKWELSRVLLQRSYLYNGLKMCSDRTNNLSTVDTIPLAPNEPNKANLKTNVLNQEIALPCRESLRYISSQLNKGKNEFCISIKVNLDTGKIISVKIGRNSKQETNSFRNIY